MKLRYPIKQYGDFRQYPYLTTHFERPLSDEDRAVINRAIERIRSEVLAAFHASERECESAI